MLLSAVQETGSCLAEFCLLAFLLAGKFSLGRARAELDRLLRLTTHLLEFLLVLLEFFEEGLASSNNRRRAVFGIRGSKLRLPTRFVVHSIGRV